MSSRIGFKGGAQGAFIKRRPDGWFPSSDISEMFHRLCLVAEGMDEVLWPEIVVTCIMDGKHASDSRHYQGKAVDIRTRAISNTAIAEFIRLADMRFRIKVELDGDRSKHYWVNDPDTLTFPANRGPNQHLHLELL